MTISELKNKLLKDKNGKIVVGQWPNVYIWLWALARIAEHIVKRPELHKPIWWIGTISLLIWAVLEALQGVNYFRKGLGYIILVLTIISVIKELI